ncbi:hypothetical protein [Pontibacter korlensis]|nr:hypothetical protein [Pontibacter korlensis]
MKTELAKNGEITKGYIFESKDVGGKGTTYHYYTFKVANTLYENHAANGEFSEKDSIYIVYDIQNPDKNWALKLLENDYPDQLQKNPNYLNLKNNEHLTRAKAY